jgi:hypothetical protein
MVLADVVQPNSSGSNSSQPSSDPVPVGAIALPARLPYIEHPPKNERECIQLDRIQRYSHHNELAAGCRQR